MKANPLWRLSTMILIVGTLQDLLVAEDSETDSIYIAIHCEKSSGNPAQNYLEFGQSLVKIISMLSAEQQARVFGFKLSDSHTSANKAGKTKASSGDQTSSQTKIPEEETTLLDMLWGRFGEF